MAIRVPDTGNRVVITTNVVLVSNHLVQHARHLLQREHRDEIVSISWEDLHG